MDKDEREMKILLAATKVLVSSPEMTLGEQRSAMICSAYEIDGVEALVMAAEDSLIMYHDADEYDNAQEKLRAAASRVREAMTGGET